MKQTAKMLALSSRNIAKYETLRGEDVSPEKRLLQKAASIKKINIAIRW